MLNDRLIFELSQIKTLLEDDSRLKEFSIVSAEPLKIEFILSIKNFEYKFSSLFPKYFPTQVIVIKKITEFRTIHSYGDGSMCLKYGVDNWRSDITLAMLIHNLIELLEDENPLGDEHGESESGDQFSVGQAMRYVDDCVIIFPYYTLDNFKDSGEIELYEKKLSNGKTIFFVKKIDNMEIQNNVVSGILKKVSYLKSKFTNKEIDKVFNIIKDFGGKEEVFLISSDQLFTYLTVAKGEFINVDIIYTIEEIEKRLPFESEIFDKKIGIIGLGSIGSRVLIDLARAGFKNFYINDPDIMLPYNVMRHELDIDSCGEYKVIALADYVKNKINPLANIEANHLNFMGQESSTSTDRFLNNLSKCELIIDCTANDNMLLLIDSVVKTNDINFLSGTVKSGGIGNIIFSRKKGENISTNDILSSLYLEMETLNFTMISENNYDGFYGEKRYVASMSDCTILSGLLGKMACSLLSGLDLYDYSDNIYIFSTSHFGDFKEPFYTYRFKAHPLPEDKQNYSEDDIVKGRGVYEDYCAKRNIK